MAKHTYDEALRELLKSEGGFVNHPSDPGGATNYGITIADYRKYVKPNATVDDVRRMTVSEAKAIYRARYWDAMRCDELPAGVDHAVFDYGVNSGIGRAPKVLQRVLGVTADGVIGPKTLAAANAADPIKVINGICDERMRFLRGLSTWPVFGKGWTSRVSRVRSVSLKMAKAVTPSRQSSTVNHNPEQPAPAPAPAAKQRESLLVKLIKVIFNGLAR